MKYILWTYEGYGLYSKQEFNSLEEIKDYLFQGGAHREVIVTILTEIVLENKYE